MGSSAADTAARLYAAWNDGGVAAIATRFWAPDIIWRDDPSVPDAEIFEGREAVTRHIDERVDLLGDFEILMHEILEAAPGRVLAIYTFKGAGGASGAPYEMRIAQTLTIQAGMVVDVQDHLDPDRARADVLSEEDAAAGEPGEA